MLDREQLLAAIAAQEQLRGTLPDEVVDVSIGALRAQLDGLAQAESGPRERRGQATVLFADVAGFTAWSEDRDPELMATLMNELWAVVDAQIEQHGGHVDKHIGDAVMGVWGAKTIQEDDPERAVRAALGLRTAFEEFRERRDLPIDVRIGVNTGPVLFGAVGTSGEQSVTGDAVNVASRIEGVAPKGGILVSHDTYRLVRGIFDVQPQEPVAVKGKSEPLRTYLVDREKSRAFRLRSRGVEGVETQMVGRDAELARLQDAFEDSAARRQARVVTVVGEAGAGKSRLLDELTAWLDLRPEPITYLKGRAVPDRHVVPRSLLRELFAFRFEILDDDRRADVATKLRAGFSSMSAADAATTGQWLGFDLPDDADAGPLAGSPEFGAIAESLLIRFLRAITVDDPAVMVLEDIHWADGESLDTVVRIVEQLESSPLLVVAVARPSLDARRSDWGAGPGEAARIDLSPLGHEVTRGLVEHILRRVDPLPTALVDLVVAHADGNPFYVEELIKTLVDDEVVLVAEDGPWTVSPGRLRGLTVPPTLAGVLQARLDALPVDERNTLQHASVVGRTFWDEAVVDLLAADEPNTDVRATLDRSSRRELVYHNDRSSFSGCEEFRFKHALLRDAAYETVLLRHRQRLHSAAATWMEQRAGDRLDEHLAQIAEHLVLADEPARAAPLFARAAAKAAATGAVSAGVSLSERALRCFERIGAAHGIEATGARLELARSLDRAGDAQAAHEQLEVVAADAVAAGDTALEALALAHLARLAMSAGDWSVASALLDSCGPMAETLGGSLLAEVLLGRAWLVEANDDPALAVDPARRALEISRSIGDAELELRAHNQLSICAARLDDIDLATAHIDAGLALARRIGNHLREATLLNTQGALTHLRATLDGSVALGPAIDLYRQAAELSHELGDLIGETSALINVAQASIEAGLLEDGRLNATRCLEIAWNRGRYPDAGFAVLVLAQATIAGGELAAGLAMIGTVLADPRTDDEGDEVARILGTLGLDEAEAERQMAIGHHRALATLVPELLASGAT